MSKSTMGSVVSPALTQEEEQEEAPDLRNHHSDKGIMLLLCALWSIAANTWGDLGRVFSGRPPLRKEKGISHASVTRIIRSTSVETYMRMDEHAYIMHYGCIEFDPDSQEIIRARMREMDPLATVEFEFRARTMRLC